MSSRNEGATLTAQADYLHRRLLGGPADPGLQAQYARAVETLLVDGRTTPSQAVDVDRLIARGLDPEAVEHYVRLRHGNNELGRRLHVLIYLIEIRQEYFDRLTLESPSRIGAWWTLFGVGLRMPFLVLKGWWQTTRHGLVATPESETAPESRP